MSDTTNMTEADWLRELKIKDDLTGRQSAIIAKLRKALEFYADEMSWQSRFINGSDAHTDAWIDKGNTARAALAPEGR